jgi:hypothetical protein
MHCSKEQRFTVREVDAPRFACNAINVGRLILLNEISSELSRRLEACGFQVVQVNLAKFLKAGGAATCMALRLSEMDAAHGGERARPGGVKGCQRGSRTRFLTGAS